MWDVPGCGRGVAMWRVGRGALGAQVTSTYKRRVAPGGREREAAPKGAGASAWP